MKTPKAFNIYLDNAEQIMILNVEQRGELLTALLEFVQGKKDFDFSDGMVKMCFSFMSKQITRDFEKYEERCAALSEFGKKGGRPKKQENQENLKVFEETNENLKVFSKSQKSQEEEEKEEEYKEEYKNKEENKDEEEHNTTQRAGARASESECESEFTRFWKIYPKRINRSQALIEFKAAVAKDASIKEIIESARNYAISVKGREQRYIKTPVNWLKGECWKDYVDDESTIENKSSYDIEKLNEIDNLDNLDELIAKMEAKKPPDDFVKKKGW